MSQPLLKVTDLAKSFSGVWALSSAQLTVGAGEIHALLGENGAGKSTLLKALAGAQPQTRGEIWFNGETLPVDDSPVERQNKGIITIYQEFNLLPNMTVAENMFLGREPRKRNLIVDERAVNQEAQVILDYLQLNVAPTTPVARLSVAQQQMVEIARALTLNARLIIMDEPSAALSDSEVESLHRVVRELKNRGVSIIYVTHRLHEVFQLCDRFTVFQDGRFTGTGAVGDTISIYNNGVLLDSVVIGNTGTWSYTTPVLAEGNHVLTIRETDPAGNQSGPSAGFTVVVDSVSATPVITNVTDNVGNAATTVVSGELTNDATPTLTGTADANSVVTIFDGGTQIAVVTADNTGTWTFTPDTALGEGSHSFTVRATDPQGNLSAVSAPWSVVVDLTAPTVPTLDNVNDDVSGGVQGNLTSGGRKSVV